MCTDENKRFPDCFPVNFVEKILPKEAVKQEIAKVYRINKHDKICRKTFLSSYEENPNRFRRLKERLRQAGTYSTSCFEQKADAAHILEHTMKSPPRAKIISGMIAGHTGPSMRSKSLSSHIDWWIYKDARPEENFEVE